MTPINLVIERVSTQGLFQLDGGSWEVTNNIWLVGDEEEVLVVDAVHDHRPIAKKVADRKVKAIVLTHGHNDHINAAIALREAVDAPVYLHRADRMLWEAVYSAQSPDRELTDGQVIRVGRTQLQVVHTPGHSPGSCCFLVPPSDGGGPVVFSGDTLFCGGPGATGRKYSDEPTILTSIRQRLFTLPEDSIVHTGHGESTTIGAEAGGVKRLLAERATRAGGTESSVN